MSLLVVLVRTHSPGNLGAAARAAKNFGAALTLVAPAADRAHPDALAFASGAEDVLARAEVLEDLGPLVERADELVGLTSLRGRSARGLPPATTWPQLRRSAAKRRVALVFGPERGGLTNDELSRASARLAIPTRPELPTMNLAQAVAATLALATHQRTKGATTPVDRAPERALARLFDDLTATLGRAGYPGKGYSAEVLRELVNLLRRAEPTEREVTVLLGALAALRRAMERAP